MGSWGELRRYCHKHGFLLHRTDHQYYEVRHPITNETLLQKISHGNGEIPANQWKMMLKRQLRLTQEQFNQFK